MQGAAQFPSSADSWDRHKDLVKELYIDKKKPMKEVLEILETQHGFMATPNMFKKRLRMWKFEKNLRPAEMIDAARRQSQRSRIDPVLIKGRPVSTAQINRFLRRNGMTRNDALQDLPETKLKQVRASFQSPSISTPSIPRSPGPNSFSISEQTLKAVSDFIHMTLDPELPPNYQPINDISIPSPPMGKTENYKTPVTYLELTSSILEGVSTLSKGRYTAGGALLERGFRLLQGAIHLLDARSLTRIIIILQECANEGQYEVKRVLLDFIYQLCTQLHGPSSPHALWARGLRTFNNDPAFLLVFAQAYCDTVVNILGRFHCISLRMGDMVLRVASDVDDWDRVSEKWGSLLHDTEISPVTTPAFVEMARGQYASILRGKGMYGEVEAIFENRPILLQEAVNDPLLRGPARAPEIWSTVAGCAYLAEAIAKQGRGEEAEELFRFTLINTTLILGKGHPLILNVQGTVAQYYRSLGRERELAEVLEDVDHELEPYMLKTTGVSVGNSSAP